MRKTLIFTDRSAGVSARLVRADGARAPQKVVSRTSSRRSFQLSLKREDSLPTYSPQPAVKRATKRLTSRFPLKISAPFQSRTNNDAASSRYSRDSTELRMPDPAHHPANRDFV